MASPLVVVKKRGVLRLCSGEGCVQVAATTVLRLASTHCRAAVSIVFIVVRRDSLSGARCSSDAEGRQWRG